MTEITAVNEAARARGLSYGQYVLRNEEPVPSPEPPPEVEEEMRTCLWCGTEFPVPEDRRAKDKKYCCKACQNHATNQKAKEARQARKKPLVCPECGAEFVQENGRQKFCSAACRRKDNNRKWNAIMKERKERERMEKDRDVQFTHSEPETVEEQPEKALQTELATTAGSPSSDLTSIGYLPPLGEGFVPEQEKKHDPVNHPSHYTQGGVECKDVIRAAVTGLEGYEAFLTGNAIKYLWRWKRKNGAEDLRKAGFWIRELIRELEERNEENN